MAGAQPIANGVMNGVAPGAVVAVSEVTDALPAPDLGGLTIESQTNAIGLIHPPPDIRAIVDKTAQFVAKNGAEMPYAGSVTPPPHTPGCTASILRPGVVLAPSKLLSFVHVLPVDDEPLDCAGPEFEKHILANERENVKFNFLKSTDPYHAYYDHRVSPRPALALAFAQRQYHLQRRQYRCSSR